MDPVGMEIKVTLLRWLLVHGLFIGGSAYVFLLVIDPFNLDGFRGLLLSLANATLGTNWQSIDRFFHVFWVKPIVQFEMRKNAISVTYTVIFLGEIFPFSLSGLGC